METLQISVQGRQSTGKALASLRSNGHVPGVVYGKGVESRMISVDELALARLYSHAGSSSLIELTLDDQKPVHVLIHDVQKTHLGKLSHVDFLQVKMNESIRTEVPLKMVGDAPGVFNLGGSLVQNLEEVEVEALPANLPSAIEVDVSGLEELDASLSVADLKIPDGVTLLTDAHELVCRVEAPRSEEELAELDAEMGEAVTHEEGDGESAETADVEKGE